MDHSQTIPVQFKRKLSDKHSVQRQNIRPKKVLDDAKWPVTNSQLYRYEGVTVSDSWSDTLQDIDQDRQLNKEKIYQQKMHKK